MATYAIMHTLLLMWISVTHQHVLPRTDRTQPIHIAEGDPRNKAYDTSRLNTRSSPRKTREHLPRRPITKDHSTVIRLLFHQFLIQGFIHSLKGKETPQGKSTINTRYRKEANTHSTALSCIAAYVTIQTLGVFIIDFTLVSDRILNVSYLLLS